MKATKQEYYRALRIFTGLCSVHDSIGNGPEVDRVQKVSSFERAINIEVPPGLYEHFKSVENDPKFYLVHSATAEVNRSTGVVTYASLYGDKAGVWTHRDLLRVADGFLSPIKRETYVGPRFRLIEKLTPRQIVDILDYVGELKTKTD